MDYRYNIRGWLTSINGLDLDNPVNGGPKDLWGMELSYDRGFEKKQYNGNISGAKWTSARTAEVHAYGYQYDKLNRLKQADYRYSEDGGSNWSNSKQDFTVFGIDYDLNGNILKLNRQGTIDRDEAGNWTFGAMDRLEYSYEANYLVAVDDKAASHAVAGDFMDIDQLYCSTQVEEYHYDANGSLVEDKNKGLSGMEYNHLNLPTKVMTEEGEVRYGYDAAGIKLWKEVWEDGVMSSRTDYLGEFSYQNGQLAFIHHEEGRFLPKVDSVGNLSQFKSEYHYKDHLGNLRLSFREESAEYEVTMETANATAEEERFEHVSETRLIGAGAHTGTAVAQLNGGNASRTMGPATVMSVNKGDKIELSVYSKFNSSDLNVTLHPNPEFGTIGHGGFEGGSGIFSSGGMGIVLTPIINQVTSGQPQAYARIVIVDEDGNELQEQFELISNTANRYNSLTLQLAVEFDGYAIVYLANESMMDVFFDELRVKHERLVWQENSYYPFGMSIKPLDKEGEPNHRFTYNGKELEETTNLLEYGQRDYDPQLGRFHKVDRFAESYHTFTPYHYGLNNPIMNIDVNGDYVRIFSSDGNASYIYQNGKLHHYTQDSEGNVTVGEEYKGDGNGKYHDSFVQQAFDDLNKINSVDEGQTVINELTSSSAVYNIKYIDHIVKDMGYDQLYADGSIPEHYQNLGLLNSRYNPELKTLYVGSGTATGHFDVNFNSLFVTGHELFHAYQDEIGSLERLSISKNSQGVRLREVQAVGFESYLRAKLNIQGYGVRTDYSAEFDSGSVPAQLNEYNHKEFVWDWLNSGYKYTPWSASDFIQNKAVWKDLYKRLKK